MLSKVEGIFLNRGLVKYNVEYYSNFILAFIGILQKHFHGDSF